MEAVAAALLTAKVRQNARETDTFDTADSADTKDKTLHTFEKCHHCAVGLSYAAPQTHESMTRCDGGSDLKKRSVALSNLLCSNFFYRSLWKLTPPPFKKVLWATCTELSKVRRTSPLKEKLIYHCLLVRWWKEKPPHYTVMKFDQVICHHSMFFTTAEDTVNAKKKIPAFDRNC